MTLQLSMRKSKDVVFPDEVAEWADMSTAMLRARAAGYCMVVNFTIHLLMCQSEIRLKRALDIEEKARQLHCELDLARGEILQAKNGARSQQEQILAMIEEKEKHQELISALTEEKMKQQDLISTLTEEKVKLQRENAIQEVRAEERSHAIKRFKESSEFHDL
ncbi:PREDICTED: uncharacterized protein LOC104596093 [Nelumbo nucifera]|uniref:Uncharacterized protein LOC104596093 n=1 Tax=Nelumbo nucifera TaxID=4432 RepID=A0A1U8Q4Z4_NELNU|nr:PREDICTED: uncharacterized protein LOC104596093 [Nelumbo nucifera]